MQTAAPSAAPGSEQPRAKTPTGVILAAAVAVIFVWLSIAYAWFIMPRFVEIFEDFDMELPGLTVLTFSHGRTLIPLVALLIGVAMVVIELVMRRSSVPTAARVLLRVLPLAMMTAFVLILFLSVLLPLVRPMTSVL